MSYNPSKPPNVPPLVTLSGAAEILGIGKSGVRKLVDMPEPVAVGKGPRDVPLYEEAAVRKLAEERSG